MKIPKVLLDIDKEAKAKRKNAEQIKKYLDGFLSEGYTSHCYYDKFDNKYRYRISSPKFGFGDEITIENQTIGDMLTDMRRVEDYIANCIKKREETMNRQVPSVFTQQPKKSFWNW